MQHPRRAALGQQARGRNRARGDEEIEFGLTLAKRGDQRQQRLHLAHAGAMQPGKPAFRTRQPGLAETLADAIRLFLACRYAPRHMAAQQRACHVGCGAIGESDQTASRAGVRSISGANCWA